MERGLRLRLVVRRDGLPEERLMWNISLDNDPTISKLLEKVNETIPLEIDQRGLENYVVELHDDDGTSFECLHFQPVRTILKSDDRVFIRSLDRDDNRRRRVSGRYQISTDGRHLIDGIPFGRRLLKTPAGRPSVILPPRKRPRLAYNDEDEDSDFEDGEDTPMLLLTNGERPDGAAGSSRITADFDDADAEDGEVDSGAESDDADNDSESDDYSQDGSEVPSDEENLEAELQDLMEDNADLEEEADPETRHSDTESLDESLESVHDCSDHRLRAAFPSAPGDLCTIVLGRFDGDLEAAYIRLAEGFEPKLPLSALLAPQFPKKYFSSNPSTSRDVPTKGKSSQHAEENPHDAMRDDEDRPDQSDDEDEEDISAFVRQFDRRGLPPGSITSGKGLAHMAAISDSLTNNKISGESETTSATLNGNKASPEKKVNEDDETSNAATTSSSENGDSEAESDSNDDDEEEDENASSDDNDKEDSDNNDSKDDGSDLQDDSSESQSDASANSDSQSEDDSDDSDSGPEETHVKPNTLGKSRQMNQRGTLNHGNGMNRDDTDRESSWESSNDSGSSSENSSDDESRKSRSIVGLIRSVHSILLPRFPSVPLPPMPSNAAPKTSNTGPQVPDAVPQPKTVPPGAGKDSTRRRNARRRAAKKAKKQAQQAQQATVTTDALSPSKEAQPIISSIDEKALFEAKRQELLNAIANGGVEVGPFNHNDNSPDTSTTTKRKRQEQDGLDQQISRGGTPAETPASGDAQSSASAQKRRRVDVGAGRRILFGALGLRNPKTKEDEDKLREKLMEGVRPLQTPRLEQAQNDTEQTSQEAGDFTEEDPDAWKDKINYRAVECCQEGVELSEPPFPFVQRWDPQQQGSWSQKKNKRGGQSKRAQRNETHYYQDSRSNKKRKHDESSMWDEEGYEDTFNGIDDANNADVELNYDDPEDGQYYETNEPTNDVSQFTDVDDLPSLPSDLSTLAILRPGEVQVGMVITWQQWSCSSATSWQPQLSNVTGVVVRIDDDATGLEVCLAKRDRYLDRNEKKYDHSTGQRIYDKFEAPDLDEDEDEDDDEGFRTIGFAEMQQPRILQQPLPTMTMSQEPSEHPDDHPAENPESEVGRSAAQDINIDATSERSILGESTKASVHGAASSKTSQLGQGQPAGDSPMSNISQISSPSRQLHESTSQAIIAKSGDLSTRDISSRKDVGSDFPSDKPSPSISCLDVPSARQSSAPLFDSCEESVAVGTPKTLKSRVTVPPCSARSGRSGRQPDYAMDMDDTQPDSLKITDDGIAAALDSKNPPSDKDVSTPTPKPAPRNESVSSQEDSISGGAQLLSPDNLSTSSSLPSIDTIWNTAQTSRDTQTSSNPLSQLQSQEINIKDSQETRVLKDREYEKAMQKLDDFSDDQSGSSRIPDSFKKSSQGQKSSQSQSLDSVKKGNGITTKAPFRSPQIKISPPPTRKGRASNPPSQFSLPPGTQVVELSSDSEPEPVYTEDYADEEVDATYSPEMDSFPQGNGWVHKKVEGKNRNARSVTAPMRPRPNSPPTSSNFGTIKARRKTSSKF
ncbi:hypothetical protein F4804DRAFT_315495 [Jackrogersella minutella]|nr:hypothetical protein F4804DRAFT_315495 [Jackrogersella minutella]